MSNALFTSKSFLKNMLVTEVSFHFNYSFTHSFSQTVYGLFCSALIHLNSFSMACYGFLFHQAAIHSPVPRSILVLSSQDHPGVRAGFNRCPRASRPLLVTKTLDGVGK